MTTIEAPEIRSRITLEGDATFAGLTALLMTIPDQVPNDTEIVDINGYTDHDHDDDGNPVNVVEKLVVTLEWGAA